jgi:tRNA U38,U39,U40 pseudouridine synthase TruA
MTKKPDQVVNNPGIMPYTTNVGAPAIQKDDVELWKHQGISKVNHQFKARFEELKKQYQQLVDEFEWNDLVYNAKYYKGDHPFLSLIGPDEWDKPYIGSFTLDSNNKWIKCSR